MNRLNGSYKTNTYKRMEEQAVRERKKDLYQSDIIFLQYLLEKVEEGTVSKLEIALTIKSLRKQIRDYYLCHKGYLNKGKCGIDIKYPEINHEYPDSFYNKEVPKKQKRLAYAGITNTEELILTVEEFGRIYEKTLAPKDEKAERIKKIERQSKLLQGGDIHFTPPVIAEKLVAYAKINEGDKVLEPSAGIGVIADEIRKVTTHIDVAEISLDLIELLKLKGYDVVSRDFLSYMPGQIYDAVIMNPPFSKEVIHIKHAYEILKDQGNLVCIASNGWTYRKDKEYLNFKVWLEHRLDFSVALPSRTFEKTNYSAKILVLHKDIERDLELDEAA